MLEKDFVKIWVEKIKGGILKDFPADFINGIPVQEIELPGKMLILGPELFGTFELTDSKGNPFLHTTNFSKVKYYLYANRTTPLKMMLPEDEEAISKTVKDYEKHLDAIVTMMEKEFKANFPDSKSFNSVSNLVFSTLNLQRY